DAAILADVVAVTRVLVELPGHEPEEQVHALLAFSGQEEVAELLVDDLGLVVAEHALPGAVNLDDPSVGAEGEDAEGGVIEHGTEALVALAPFLLGQRALGHVLELGD